MTAPMTADLVRMVGELLDEEHVTPPEAMQWLHSLGVRLDEAAFGLGADAAERAAKRIADGPCADEWTHISKWDGEL